MEPAGTGRAYIDYLKAGLDLRVENLSRDASALAGPLNVPLKRKRGRAY